MVRKVLTPLPTKSIVDESRQPEQDFRAWIQIISERSLIISKGSPEGVIEANQGANYMDEDGSVGNVLYLKQKANVGGDKKLGWVLIG